MEKDAKAVAQLDPAKSPSYVDGRDIPGLIALFERRAQDDFGMAQMRVVEPDCIQPLADLESTDPDFGRYIQTVVVEAGVAQMARDGASRRFASRLSPEQVRYLDEMAGNFLRVWLVRDADPGVGLTLQDHETGEIVEVREVSGSGQMVPMQLVVGRVIRDQPFPTFSNCFLTRQQDVDSLRTRFPRNTRTDAREQSLLWEIALVRDFVRRCVRPAPIILMDAATDTLLEFVHDRFTVTDEPTLVARLNTHGDIDPDPDHPTHWRRFVELDDVQVRSLAHLNLEGGVLVVESRSRVAAKDNRAWLKDAFGDLLRFRSRKIEPVEAPTGRRKEPVAPREPPIELPAEAFEELYRSTYRTWAGTPLPAFENQTPRAKGRTPSGEKAVVAMVRSYQAQENTMARDQKRASVDLSWLLRDCGIDPKKL